MISGAVQNTSIIDGPNVVTIAWSDNYEVHRPGVRRVLLRSSQCHRQVDFRPILQHFHALTYCIYGN